jgi:hypothetical protein
MTCSLVFAKASQAQWNGGGPSCPRPGLPTAGAGTYRQAAGQAGFSGFDLVSQVQRVLPGDLGAGGRVLGVAEPADLRYSLGLAANGMWACELGFSLAGLLVGVHLMGAGCVMANGLVLQP